MNGRIEIEFWVRDRAVLDILPFYPTVVAKDLLLPINVVFDKLVDMVLDGKLVLLWEIVCPICSKPYLLYAEQAKEAIGKSKCADGHEFVIATDDVLPKFEITSHYRGIVEERN